MARQSSVQQERTDAISLLIEDHRRIDKLFQAFEQAGRTAYATKQQLVHDMIRELSVHAVIEEQFLYPATRAAFEGGYELAQESLDEHQAVKELLHTLERLRPQDHRFDDIVGELISEVREHVEEEERELFPGLRKALSPERLESMGRALAAAKATSPSRPHPNAPNTPPLNYVVGPVAAVADRVRDAMRGG